MAVNAPDDVRRAVRLFEEPWFRNSLAGRNRDGERVLIAADNDTPLGEVLDAIAREGDAGNLVVFHDGAVTILVLERFDPDAAHVVRDRIAIDEDGTVATLIDVCRSAAGGGDVRLTVGYDGSCQGIRVAGFQHEAVAA